LCEQIEVIGLVLDSIGVFTSNDLGHVGFGELILIPGLGVEQEEGLETLFERVRVLVIVGDEGVGLQRALQEYFKDFSLIHFGFDILLFLQRFRKYYFFVLR